MCVNIKSKTSLIIKYFSIFSIRLLNPVIVRFFQWKKILEKKYWKKSFSRFSNFSSIFGKNFFPAFPPTVKIKKSVIDGQKNYFHKLKNALHCARIVTNNKQLKHNGLGVECIVSQSAARFKKGR